MNYDFPAISTIEEVRRAIIAASGDEFIEAVRPEGYTVFNYTHAVSDTFGDDLTDPFELIRRECRGLVFDTETGRVISRRFHKFFNYGERAETAEIDLSRPHVILEKLDGSMITPIVLNGVVRWGTKMGLTEIGSMVDEFVATRPNYVEFAIAMNDAGMTPIFEFCSRKNRVVIDHPNDRLVLLAVRDNVSGAYQAWNDLELIAEKFDVPLVDYRGSLEDSDNFDDFVAVVRQAEGTEGVIIRFEDGHMVKVKADTYLRMHRVKASISNEARVVDVIINDDLDDVIPLLNADDASALKAYQDAFWSGLYDASMEIGRVLADVRMNAVTRKEFALTSMTMNSSMRSVVFWGWDRSPLGRKEIEDHIIDMINSSGRNKVTKFKDAFFPDCVLNIDMEVEDD